MAKHRAKFGWLPLSDVVAVMLPRHKNRWNLLGCPKLPDQSEPLLGRCLPYCGDMWRRYCCLTSFFSDCRYVPSLQRYSPTRLCDGAEGVIYDDSCESKEELAPLQCPWGTFKDHSNFCHVMPFRNQFLVWPDGVMVKALACDSSSTPGCSAVR